MNNKKPFALRYIKEGENKKMITTIAKKIYFSKDQNIIPGYYVGAIIEEQDNYGVFDAIPINKLPVDMWVSNQVSGAFVKVNKKDKKISIFLSKAPENRDEEKPVKIIELNEAQAKELWGKDYKKNIVKRKGGVKRINSAGYTPFEKLKEIIDKSVK